MSYSEAELWQLLHQATHLPYGPGQIALVEQVITRADALGLPELSFAARMRGTEAYYFGGEPVRAFPTFAWCLAEYDRDPQRYAEHERTLLWHFKHMVSAMTEFPEISLERTYAVLDDMQRRWTETGHSLQAVYAYRHEVAVHIGDLAAAQEYYLQWCAAPRDDLSDCAACDTASKADWLVLCGQDEEAVAVGESVLSGQVDCTAQPQGVLTTLMFPYLRTGRLDQARDAHRRAYRRQRSHLADLAAIAHHIEFCARTGNEARAVEMVERHLGWLDLAPSPWDVMVFAAVAALALRRAQDRQPRDELTVHRPAHGDRPAGPVAALDLAAELADQATDLAARFDQRNGTSRVGELVRDWLVAEPLVEYLPLSPTARRPSPSRPSTVVVAADPTAPPPPAAASPEPAAPPSAPVEAATTAPDEPLDLIERIGEATARGDQATAADLRHRLASAYLQTNRLLDAAEVAEEELAYRLANQASPGGVRHLLLARGLLATIYERLGQPTEAVEQIDALVDEAGRFGLRLRAAELAQRAGEILYDADEHEEAAARFRVAADAYAESDQPVRELHNRWRQADALRRAARAAEAVTALDAADRVAARVTGDDPDARWELASLDLSAARVLRAAGRLADAEQRAERAVRASTTFDHPEFTAQAYHVLSAILLDLDRPAEAEAAIQQALAVLPDGAAREPYLEVLEIARQAQSRPDQAEETR